jgi:acylphosphatase
VAQDVNGKEFVEIHAIVRGEVQGVAFRHTTRSYALKLGLVGTVKNLPDGGVEILAQGTKHRVDTLMDQLLGPNGPGTIQGVEREYGPAIHRFEGFQIII